MNITDQAAKVLAEIDAALAICEKASAGPWATKLSVGDYNVKVTNIWTNIVGKRIGAITHKNPDHESNATFIASARTVCPKSLRCLKTAIEGLLKRAVFYPPTEVSHFAETQLTALITKWNENK